MSDAKKDEIKGRAKEAAGAVAGDDDLKTRVGPTSTPPT